MHLQEIILCSTAPSGASGEHGIIAIHDIETGSTLASFKHTNSTPHGTTFTESRNAQGGFILSLQRDKPILNVYNFQKVFLSFYGRSSGRNLRGIQDQIALKIVLPEKLTCIAMDHRGDYCAGGTAHGRIHFWEVSLTFNSFPV
jgi:pre-rRNA-processing protein IPI3